LKSGLEKRLRHRFGKAVHDWGMIKDKDRILVGISGGRDSLTLLQILFIQEKIAPVKFDIVPVHIDPGFEGSFAKDLEKYVLEKYKGQHFKPLQVEYTDYGPRAHSKAERENPCFLCARMRRTRLFEIAEEQGCKKIALGHNKDDIIETLFINMFYAGKIAAMKPRQSFFSGAIDIIRPLSYVEKKDIILFSNMQKTPVFVNNCPSANSTKRSEIRSMLESLYITNKNIKGNIFRAMGNIASDYLLEIEND